MSPSGQERLFKIAEGNCKTARYLLKGLQEHAIRNENFFYLIQQVLEKVMKAVLVHQQLPVPLLQDLGMLIAKIPKGIEPSLGYELNSPEKI